MSDQTDLDDLRRDDLPPLPKAVADVLDDWLVRHHGVMSSHHNAGSFLRLLNEAGYTVVDATTYLAMTGQLGPTYTAPTMED